MSLRGKFILALLACSLAAVGLVGAVAYERLMHKFSDMVQQQASRNFRADVAAYIGAYGSWEAARAAEPFREFSERRNRPIDAPGGGPRGFGPPPPPPGGWYGQAVGPGGAMPPGPPAGYATEGRDSGAYGPPPPPDRNEDGASVAAESEAAGASPVPAPPAGLPRAGAPTPLGNLVREPFHFLLLSPEGRVLTAVAPYQEGETVAADLLAQGEPVRVNGAVAAYVLPQGEPSYSDLDLGYLSAMREALGYGVAAAAGLALVLGLLFGTGLSRSLQRLTTAIRRMEKGRLMQRVEVRSRDEIGVLAQAFNRMSRELAQSHAELNASNAQIRAQAEQLRELSIRDALTQLHNRRYFDEHAGQQYDLAMRHGQPLAVMIGDIDFFKRINDGFSHAMGDAVLRQVAEILRAQVRHTDFVARYGGEEFVIAFPETGLAQARGLCEKLREAIAAWPWHTLAPDLHVTMSMGICDDLAAGSLEAMVRVADEQLYRAKSTGRNKVCIPA